MIEDIIKYELKEGGIINFDDIDKIDIDAIYLIFSTFWYHWLRENVSDKYQKIIKEKYIKLIWDFNEDLWRKKMFKIIDSFDEKNFLKHIKYVENRYIHIYWEKEWLKNYCRFLSSKSSCNFSFDKYIKNNPKMFNFFDSELRKLFKYFPWEDYKVWFALDDLHVKYFWLDHWNLDNKSEYDTRYRFWEVYKEKWIIEEIKSEENFFSKIKKIFKK